MASTIHPGRAAALLASAFLIATAVHASSAAAQDTTTTTSAPSTTATTISPGTIPVPNTPLGPVERLVLTYDPAAGTISIENPCGTGGENSDPQQVTYDLFLVPETGKRTQLAKKQSPYATVDAYQTTTYTIPATLPHGTYEVLLQCSALPITISHERQQFSTRIDWQGRAAPAPAEAAPAAAASPVDGDPSFTG